MPTRRRPCPCTMPLYKELDPATVPAQTRQVAQRALDYGCRVLGLPLPPEVTFMHPATTAEFEDAKAHSPDGGWTFPGYVLQGIPSGHNPNWLRGIADARWRIWIATGWPDRDTAHAVLHELKHMAILRDGKRSAWGTKSREWEEAECERFVRQHIGALGY